MEKRIVVYSISKDSGIYTSDGRHQSAPPFIDFILNDSDEDCIQGFVSLDADVSGLLALLDLEDEELERLHDNERLNIAPYKLTYFPQKFFGIDRGGGTGHPFSNIADVSQYDKSLDHVENSHDDEYWFARAYKAYKVAKEAYDVFVELGLNPRNIISPKSVYEPEFNKLNLPKLSDIPERAVELAYEACMGNWVECYRRGHFPRATDYDISSAYPSWAARLLDFRYGQWIESTEYQPEAKYGYVMAEICVDKQFSPILWQDKDDANYTYTGINEQAVTKNMLDFIDKYELGYYTITEGYWWKPRSNVRPMENKILSLYQLKQQSTGLKKEIIKRILTGNFYGSLLQETGGRPGKHYMPPYAAEIQTNTKLQLAAFVIKNNLEPRLISVAVDGVLIEGDDDVPIERNGLGSWSKSYEGEAVIVQSGLSCVEGKFGEGDFSISLEGLKELVGADLEADHWTINKNSVITLGQAHNNRKLGTVGDITSSGRTLFLDEYKREYTRKPKNGYDIMNKQYKSKSWDIGLLKEYTESHADDIGGNEDAD